MLAGTAQADCTQGKILNAIYSFPHTDGRQQIHAPIWSKHTHSSRHTYTHTHIETVANTRSSALGSRQ